MDVIHFSQLVQQLLGGSKAMLEDFLTTRPGQSIPLLAPDLIKEGSDILKVTAVFVGNIFIGRHITIFLEFLRQPEPRMLLYQIARQI
jgi:hypothetical protein